MLNHLNKKQLSLKTIQRIAIIEASYYIYLFKQQIELFWNPKYHSCLSIMGWAEMETGWNFIILYLLIATCILTWLNEAKRLAWIVKSGSLLSLFIINFSTIFLYNWFFLISLILLLCLYQSQVLKVFEVEKYDLKRYIKYSLILFTFIFVGQIFIDFSSFVNHTENYYYNYPYTFSTEIQ